MADNKFSEEKQLARCEPMSRLQSYIAGKWKILILWYISFYKVREHGSPLPEAQSMCPPLCLHYPAA